MGALYQISFPNGKSYIGITTKAPEHRFAEHRYSSVPSGLDNAVNRAIRKHGLANISFRTLAIADEPSYLLDLERKAIAAYGTHGAGGYNMTAGGVGIFGYRHTAATRQAMSAKRKGRKISPRQVEALSKRMVGNTYFLGKTHSPEVNLRRRISRMLSSRGVSFRKQNGMWLAYMMVEGVTRRLGWFEREGDALAARAAAVHAYISEVAPCRK